MVCRCSVYPLLLILYPQLNMKEILYDKIGAVLIYKIPVNNKKYADVNLIFHNILLQFSYC